MSLLQSSKNSNGSTKPLKAINTYSDNLTLLLMIIPIHLFHDYVFDNLVSECKNYNMGNVLVKFI